MIRSMFPTFARNSAPTKIRETAKVMLQTDKQLHNAARILILSDKQEHAE